MQAKTTRQKQLAIVHILKKELALSDEYYQAILSRFNVASAASLNDSGLQQLIAYMNQQKCPGKKRAYKNSAMPRVPKERQPLMRKIGALLTAKGKHEGKFIPWSYAESILKKLHDVDSLSFATPGQLHNVIAAMEYDAKRCGYNWQHTTNQSNRPVHQPVPQQPFTTSGGPAGRQTTTTSGGVPGVGRQNNKETSLCQ